MHQRMNAEDAACWIPKQPEPLYCKGAGIPLISCLALQYSASDIRQCVLLPFRSFQVTSTVQPFEVAVGDARPVIAVGMIASCSSRPTGPQTSIIDTKLQAYGAAAIPAVAQSLSYLANSLGPALLLPPTRPGLQRTCCYADIRPCVRLGSLATSSAQGVLSVRLPSPRSCRLLKQTILLCFPEHHAGSDTQEGCQQEPDQPQSAIWRKAVPTLQSEIFGGDL